LCLNAAASADEYTNGQFGFRLDLGDDWTLSADNTSATTLQLTFSGQGDLQRCQLQIRVYPPGTKTGPDDMRDAVMATIAATDGYDNAQLGQREIAERDCPDLRCDTSAAGFPGVMRQTYLAENDWLYVLQDFFPADDAKQMTRTLDRLWATFGFIPLDDAAAAQQRLLGLAGRCGSEIDWAMNWSEAAERARSLQRPVLVHARMYGGFSITDSTMSGPFMDRDVVAMINSRCVPLAVTKTAGLPFAHTDAYGLGPNTFGSSCLLLSPDGDVLWDGVSPADPLLMDALASLDSWPGTPVDESGSVFDRAQAHMVRGELEQVEALLPTPTTAEEFRLLAAVHRRRMEGPAALAALSAAADAPGAAALRHDLDVDRAEVLLGTGATDAADTLAATLLARSPAHERVPELLLLRAAVALSRDDRTGAEALLRTVVDAHHDTRWAWLAAATLTSTAWAMEKSGPSAWPDARLLAQLRSPEFEELPVERWRVAEAQALQWLLDAQNDDGSWPLPSNIGRAPDDPPHDFDLAAAALACSALIPHRDAPGARVAIDGALTWLMAAYPAERDAEPEVAFMDYAVWSRSAMLNTLADLVDNGLKTKSELRPMAANLYDELTQLAKPKGGWSYYLTGDVTAASPTALQSMSFTDAWIVLALQRATAAELIDGDELEQSGLASLDRGRLDDGSFLYMVPSNGSPQPGARGDSGAAGRGPVCSLAMHQAGRLTLQDLRDALDTFIEHKGSYTRERGKHLMHAGVNGQGSHYLLFDYATAAWTVAALPADERAHYVAPLLEMVLSSRTTAGSFVDNPIIGAPSSTSLALLAFAALQLEP